MLWLDTLSHILRYAIPLVTSALLAVGWWCTRAGRQRGSAAVTAGLAVIAVLSALNYVSVHLSTGRYSNTYEMVHYYLPTHYLPEVGYTGLYDAVVAARDELGLRPVVRVRDLRTGKIGTEPQSLARGKKLKAHFSPQRWKAWVEDVRWFSPKLSQKTWEQVFIDRGFNGTPPWTMVAVPLANQVRPGTPPGTLPLSLLDVGIWALGLGAVAWAFGPRALLLVIIVLGSHFVTGFGTLKAAFLRVDWICCLLGAMAFERRGRPATAGALVAWAGLSRVFPFVFAFGPGVALLREWIEHRRLDRRALRFLLSLALTTAAGAGLSLWATSVAFWSAFLQKIQQIGELYSAWRVGFAYVLAGAWDGNAWGGMSLPHFYSAHAWMSVGVKIAALAGAAWVVTRLTEPWERLVVGFILMYFLVGCLYYYYVALLIPALWLSTREHSGRAVVVFTALFLGSVVGNLSYDQFERDPVTFFWISATLLPLILGLGWVAAEKTTASPAP